MLFRKIYKNKWMVLCLLIGLILAISIICAIPMFSRGMLKSVIAKDLKKVESEKDINQGSYVISATLQDKETNQKKWFNGLELDKSLDVSNLGLKIKEEKEIVKANEIDIFDANNHQIYAGMDISVGAMTNIDKHIKITEGAMYSDTPSKDGYYDVIVSSDTFKGLDFEIGKVYSIRNSEEPDAQKVKIKITGVYDKVDASDGFWDKNEDKSYSIYVSYPLFKSNIVDKGVLYTNKVWYYEYFDYNQFANMDAQQILSTIDNQTTAIGKYNGNVYLPAYDTLKAYLSKEIQLKSILYVLEIPIILLIIIYTFMISDLIVEQEKNEIAVLKSRGASTFGICLTYLTQSLVISAVAMLIGPFLGVYVCKVLGVCNGFLEFTNRSGIAIKLTSNEYIYSLIAVVVFIITIMIPILLATRTTIVQFKQSKSKRKYKPFWEKYFIDIVLLAIAGYAFYNYKARESYINIAGVSSNQVPVDPILYLAMGLFTIGIALLFLRLYPYIIKFIFFLGKNKWSQAVYASLLDVSRSKGREQFLMVFLIFTVSLGIFDIKAADIINTKIESNQRYLLGADMVINAWWTPIEEKASNKKSNPNNEDSETKLPTYKEPPFSDYQNLNGVEATTKVFSIDNANIKAQISSTPNVHIMGIVPGEFAKVANFQKNLLTESLNDYCSKLAKTKNGVLISSALADATGYQIGDKVEYFWKDSPKYDGEICGIVDYWPSNDPNPNGNYSGNLIVANLSELQDKAAVQPYSVWIKKKSFDSANDINNSIKAKKLKIKSVSDINQLIAQAKKEPMIQGTNGALTLGFIATMVITAIGFVIYWILSIKGKILQFGILRAIGLSFKKIIGMILYEQIMISGVAIAMGVLIGQIDTKLFMPLMSLATEASSQAIPSSLIIAQCSYDKLIIVILVTVIVGILSLIKYISSIKMDQAIKLGED